MVQSLVRCVNSFLSTAHAYDTGVICGVCGASLGDSLGLYFDRSSKLRLSISASSLQGLHKCGLSRSLFVTFLVRELGIWPNATGQNANEWNATEFCVFSFWMSLLMWHEIPLTILQYWHSYGSEMVNAAAPIFCSGHVSDVGLSGLFTLMVMCLPYSIICYRSHWSYLQWCLSVTERQTKLNVIPLFLHRRLFNG